MKISFLGAAGEVTGSCHLVESEGLRFLVDCGMFQGGREAYAKNLRALDVDPRRLDFVLMTHAHVDHSGLLPRLVALGYRGPIYATEATCDLLEVMLVDSAHIQEKEAEWANRRQRERHLRRGHEQAPLYTVQQARDCLSHLRGVGYDVPFRPLPQVEVTMRDAGHILGSAILQVQVESPAGRRRLVFSGDLGQPGRPVLRDPTPVGEADCLLVESTYGNRLHRSLQETEDELVQVLQETLQRRGGNVVIPAFSVGRTQELLFVLTRLVRDGRLQDLDVYVDSPMATSATQLTFKHEPLLDEETRGLIRWQQEHPDRPRVRFVETVEESMRLNHVSGGAVILSASGMCEAGRIKYHLLHNLPRRSSAVVMVGFQAAGTLGRRLVDGAKSVTLFGQSVPVHARVHTIGGLSAHADQRALLGWLRRFVRPPAQTFVVHGEDETAHIFADAIRNQLGWPGVKVPAIGQVEQIRIQSLHGTMESPT